MRKLGRVQVTVLGQLARNNGGVWYGGAGWVWGTYSATVRILESLVRRGLVQEEKPGEYLGRPFRKWAITTAGRQALSGLGFRWGR